jgi:hypothetical protein
MTPAQIFRAFCRLVYPDARANVLLETMYLAPVPVSGRCAQNTDSNCSVAMFC